MSVNIEVPKIGESVATVFVAQWLRQPGDAVKAGDPVVEVDSDKASMEVPSPVDGVLMETLAEEGEEVAVGVVIARVDDSAAPAVAAPAETAKEEDTTSSETGDVRAGPAARRPVPLHDPGPPAQGVRPPPRRRIGRSDTMRAVWW